MPFTRTSLGSRRRTLWMTTPSTDRIVAVWGTETCTAYSWNPVSPDACNAVTPSSTAMRRPTSQIARQRRASSSREPVCTATVWRPCVSHRPAATSRATTCRSHPSSARIARDKTPPVGTAARTTPARRRALWEELADTAPRSNESAEPGQRQGPACGQWDDTTPGCGDLWRQRIGPDPWRYERSILPPGNISTGPLGSKGEHACRL